MLVLVPRRRNPHSSLWEMPSSSQPIHPKSWSPNCAKAPGAPQQTQVSMWNILNLKETQQHLSDTLQSTTIKLFGPNYEVFL